MRAGHGATSTAARFRHQAAQAFMIEASTGTILLAKDENQPISPASLAKLMTMDVVFDAVARGEISLDTEYPVSENAWRKGGAPSRASTMFAALKSRVRVGDLIQGVVVQQANDGCMILAEGISVNEKGIRAAHDCACTRDRHAQSDFHQFHRPSGP